VENGCTFVQEGSPQNICSPSIGAFLLELGGRSCREHARGSTFLGVVYGVGTGSGLANLVFSVLDASTY